MQSFISDVLLIAKKDKDTAHHTILDIWKIKHC